MKGTFPENLNKKVNSLRNVGGDIYFSEMEIFAFLVYAFHKEPIEVSGFDPLYLENYFEFI